jgi:hypothetical protein
LTGIVPIQGKIKVVQDWVWKTESKRLLIQKFGQPIGQRKKIKIYFKNDMA